MPKFKYLLAEAPWKEEPRVQECLRRLPNAPSRGIDAARTEASVMDDLLRAAGEESNKIQVLDAAIKG
jgi:hypothetical protein